MEVLLKAAPDFPDLEFIDFGGGFGVPYQPEEKPLDMEKLGGMISERFKNFCKKVAFNKDLKELALDW